MNPHLRCETLAADFCVVGGGMAGLIAAVAAARRGAKTVLLHDRPVLGGNASSEVRMWICGAHGFGRKEAGLLEEIQLANLRRNREGTYCVWDSVLWEFAFFTPGLRTFLNTTVNNARMENGRLVSVDAWEMTTQTWRRVAADYFLDASGDSILAPLSGAEVRHGRESREEFGESIAPRRADAKTMGNTILLQLEETSREQPYEPPVWAHRFDGTTNLPSRVGSGLGQNFWWLELGGLRHTIDDAEEIRNDLVRTAWGVWDYMKNHGPQAEKLRNWRLRWLGALPGKRENRRYVGDHILTQHDVESGGCFEDIVAYGGWSMDDHHPAGLYYPGPATIFHPAPSPYGIPLRCLYSRTVPNLFCAGRNISTTHAALSSTRVMATCALLGQAVGTAAAWCVRERCLPRDLVSGRRLRALQSQLMDDDCWLPGLERTNHLAGFAGLRTEAGSAAAAWPVLFDGRERETANDQQHHVKLTPGTAITAAWERPVVDHVLRLVFDSDLNDAKQMPCLYPAKGAGLRVPGSLVRSFRVETRPSASADWQVACETDDNHRRLVLVPLPGPVQAVRWTGLQTWGAGEVRLFSMDVCPPGTQSAAHHPEPGRHWNDVVAEIAPADLADAEVSSSSARGQSRVGA